MRWLQGTWALIRDVGPHESSLDRAQVPVGLGLGNVNKMGTYGSLQSPVVGITTRAWPISSACEKRIHYITSQDVYTHSYKANGHRSLSLKVALHFRSYGTCLGPLAVIAIQRRYTLLCSKEKSKVFGDLFPPHRPERNEPVAATK